MGLGALLKALTVFKDRVDFTSWISPRSEKGNGAAKTRTFVKGKVLQMLAHPGAGTGRGVHARVEGRFGL